MDFCLKGSTVTYWYDKKTAFDFVQTERLPSHQKDAARLIISYKGPIYPLFLGVIRLLGFFKSFGSLSAFQTEQS